MRVDEIAAPVHLGLACQLLPPPQWPGLINRLLDHRGRRRWPLQGRPHRLCWGLIRGERGGGRLRLAADTTVLLANGTWPRASLEVRVGPGSERDPTRHRCVICSPHEQACQDGSNHQQETQAEGPGPPFEGGPDRPSYLFGPRLHPPHLPSCLDPLGPRARPPGGERPRGMVVTGGPSARQGRAGSQ
jgi:hypothetical protein